MNKIKRRAGSTTGFEVILEDAGIPRNLTGLEIVLHRKSDKGVVAEFRLDDEFPVIAVSEAEAGLLAVEPGPDFYEDGVREYYFYFEVIDGSKHSFYPESKNYLIEVFPRYVGAT